MNGVDKCVREAMPSQDEEIASRKPLQKRDPNRNRHPWRLQISFLLVKQKWIDFEIQKPNDQNCFEVSKAVTRLLRHDTQVLRGLYGAIHYDDIIEESRKKELSMLRIGQMTIGYQFWQKVEEKRKEKKRFQYCLNPNSPHKFLYLRAIQGHSGRSIIDTALQDNVLLPDGFTEYIYHVKNANELRSIVNNGLIPGGKSIKRERQAVYSSQV